MLCELRIENLALINALTLNFEYSGRGGLVVMTGETGAGKSIMLRAIHLLTGRRASLDWIRSGAEQCTIEALFELSEANEQIAARLEEGGFLADTTLVVKRIISRNGRSRFYLNGSLATARVVAEITGELVTVASQHDHQKLLQPGLHLDFLDTYGGLQIESAALAKVFSLWQAKRDELAELLIEEQGKEQRRDFLAFQLAEIEDAAPEPGEDETLKMEKHRLKSADLLLRLSQQSQSLLSGKILDALTEVRKNMEQLAGLDPDAAQLAEEIAGYVFQAEDHAAALRTYRNTLESNPLRLEQVTERLDVLQGLKRKYGETIEDVLRFADDARKELAGIENMDRRVANLQEELKTLEEDLVSRAKALGAKRHDVAQVMEQAMDRELASLAFRQSGFEVRWQEINFAPETLTAQGWDRVEFFFSANPGEPARPLSKVASGGELSRLLLAMKCLLARKDLVDTVIFDEVDAGIGGEAAEAVARKIQELAGHHQVFCITHLPQIAARGDVHFEVVKGVEEGRTSSRVSLLSAEKREAELVRMLAGDSATEQTLAWAQELLRKGKGDRS